MGVGDGVEKRLSLVTLGRGARAAFCFALRCSPNQERANEEMHVHRNDVVKVMRSFLESQSSNAGAVPYIVDLEVSQEHTSFPRHGCRRSHIRERSPCEPASREPKTVFSKVL